jgi:prolyl-tRNA synthetase
MRWTNTFIPTVKENPQEAEAVSHILMVRAGLIRRLTAGAYSYLPLGFKALKKAEKIVREEMDSAGAIELLMPALQPVDLWKRTGRYDVIGDVMIKFTDRHGREVALGPTHEEIITDIVSKEIRSYKDLPVTLYQIQNKFRDELRPRFGVLRSCEFIMKDAYSFNVDQECLETVYAKMYEAYCQIFKRCGLPYIPVEADSGMMGGAGSHEFMIPSGIGEDRIAVCEACGYAASAEVAEVVDDKNDPVNKESKLDMIEEIDTPSKSTVEDVAEFLKVDPIQIVKTLVYVADEKPVIVLIRGDHEANEAKLKSKLIAGDLVLAKDGQIKDITGGDRGFSGPVGLDIPIIADNAVKKMVNCVTGANKKDKHLTGVNPGRDFTVKDYADIRTITDSDICPKCKGELKIKTAIEIGHTFKLGTKYSKALNAVFLDEKGVEKPVLMGCYGIGINRILASLIEVSHDDKGIIWPVNLAPFEAVIIPVNKNDEKVKNEAERIYTSLLEEGVDVIIDDRFSKSVGVRFKDADLIGFPIQIIIGNKNLDNGNIEIKIRKTGESTLIEAGKCVEKARELLAIL